MKSGLVTPVRAPKFNFVSFKRSGEEKHVPKTYTTSFANQLKVLLKRSMIMLSRDRTLTYSRISMHLFVALFIGTLYFGIGRDAKEIHNNANYLFYTVMFLMLTSFNCVTITCKYELN